MVAATMNDDAMQSIDALEAAGRPGAALRRLRETLTSASPVAHLERYASLAERLGATPDALAALHMLWERAPEAGPAERIAHICRQGQSLRRAAEWAGRAREAGAPAAWRVEVASLWEANLLDECLALLASLEPATWNDEERVELARWLLRLGDHPRARNLANVYCSAQAPETWALRAEIALACDQHGRVESAIERLAEMQPGDHRCDWLRGAVAARRGDWAVALEHLDRAIEAVARTRPALENPTYEYWLWRAEAKLRLGDLAGAELDCETAGHRAGDSADYVPGVVLLALIRSLRYPEERAGFSGDQGAELAYILGVLAPETPPLEGVELPRTELAPMCEAVWPLLGASRSRFGTHRVGEPDARGVFALRPIRPPIPERRLCIYAMQSVRVDPPDVVDRRFDALAEQFAASTHPHLYLAEVLLWRGEVDAASEHIEHAATLPQQSRWVWIGRTAVNNLRGDHAEALETILEGGRRFSGTPGDPVWSNRAEALLRLGRVEEAAEDLRVATQRNPRRVSAWLLDALVKVRQGDVEGARASCRQVLDRAPLVWEAAWDQTGRGARPEEALGDEATIEAALRALRGNRSATVITFVDETGALRVAG
jgi:tetratricopeptide (TPR) repeat protein